MKETNIQTFSSELMRLTAAANRDFMKLGELKAYLDANADLLNETSHTLAYGLARSLVNTISGLDAHDALKGFGSAEIVHREYKNVLEWLIEGESNTIIRLLAERAAMCWLHAQAAESHHALMRLSEARHQHDARLRMALAERRLTAAHNRFLRACAALTKMRAMIAATELMNERRGGQAKPRLALVAEKGA